MHETALQFRKRDWLLSRFLPFLLVAPGFINRLVALLP